MNQSKAFHAEVDAHLQALSRRIHSKLRPRTAADILEEAMPDVNDAIGEARDAISREISRIEQYYIRIITAPLLVDGRMRILWLDDDISQYQDSINQCRAYGIDIVGVADGRLALRLLDDDFDGLIVDLILENEDGFAFLRQIYESGIRIPSVLCSRHNNQPSVQRAAISLGAVGILDKEDISHGHFPALLYEYFALRSDDRAVSDIIRSNPEALSQLVQSWDKSKSKLPEQLRRRLGREFEIIKAESAKGAKRPLRIAAALRSAKNVAEGAAGNLTADAIADVLGSMLG